jgi:hypothetical protein
MSVLNFFKRVSFYPKSLILRWKILVARRLLLSNYPQKWYALDNLGIYGFGTDLLRIDFPPTKNPQPLWGYESQPNRALYDLLNADISDQIQLPCAHLASNQIAKELFAESFAIKEFPGCSFWLKIV